MALLEVEDLRVNFYTEDGVVRAVDGVSFRIEADEVFGIIGESGAGKSVTSRAIMGLIESPGRVEAGRVTFGGRDVLSMPDDELRELRGAEIAFVPQEPGSALNPVYTVGEQIAETIRTHMDRSRSGAKERAIDLLDRVGIPDPEGRYSDYPDQFSGGMQQRAVIAMALSCDPSLVIADEPTTALDVTVQAQILELMKSLSADFDTAIQWITHDLAVVAEICDRVAVMYAGKVVEQAPVEELYYDPKHPYTVGLMGSIARINDPRDRLDAIPGTVPDPVQLPTGCSFHPRCPYAEDACRDREPELVETESGEPVTGATDDPHAAACLEYTGSLRDGLDFQVEVREEEPR